MNSALDLYLRALDGVTAAATRAAEEQWDDRSPARTGPLGSSSGTLSTPNGRSSGC